MQKFDRQTQEKIETGHIGKDEFRDIYDRVKQNTAITSARGSEAEKLAQHALASSS